jgi:GMP synthase (glutamine-hydrolysing)
VNFEVRRFIEDRIKELKNTVGKEKAIVATSGGVDSTTCTILAHQALRKNLKVIFIDDGLMRQNEPENVKKLLKSFGIDLIIVNRKKEFFRNLKGKIDPEEKRKAFRDTFYRVLGRIVKDYRAGFLIQGTIAADIVETKKGIKTQHNVLEQIGISPKRYGLKVVEPVRDLYKPQVRMVAKALGLPEAIYNRMPFPGPGLATRVLGEVTPKRVELVRKATEIVEEELKGLRKFQAFAVLLSDKATGLFKGKRLLGDMIVIMPCLLNKGCII